ncbi:MAG: M23 family metallopeptidase [Idiomarina sp.]|nr:M23 family metallopeptidase [Idiomarina sp.]
MAWYWPIVLGLASIWGLAFALSAMWAYEVPFWGILLGYLFFAYAYRSLFRILSGKPKEPAARHPAYDWPASGPIGRFGNIWIVFTFYPTALLSAINPFQLSQQLRQVIGQVRAAWRIKRAGTDPANYQTKVSYHLPFKGEWLVCNGGLTEATSHSWGVLAQRYAYDFFKADDEYRRHRGRGTKLTDYYCYGEDILAAADGTVVKVFDGVRDAPLVGYGFADFLCRHFGGNHVIIKHADGEYGFYAHLIPSSICVQEGQQVKQGQAIGQCGHSGHSSEPHLHFHLQDTPSIFSSMGLPIRFCGVQSGDSNIAAENSEQPQAITRGMRVCRVARKWRL